MGFTNSLDLESPFQPTSDSSEVSNEEKAQKTLNANMGEESCQKKIRRNKKVENSPYHNFQKHLNSAIQKLVVLPETSESDDEYKIAAHQLWRAYVECPNKTRKILHFLFNENNEHKIKEKDLHAYGLWKIYEEHGSRVISKAKNYLSELAI